MPIEHRPVLWVNDTPEERVSEHGHAYEYGRKMPVAVSFEAANGKWVRVSFDPQSGDTTEQVLKEAGSPCPV